jgi:hypothetical protein
MKRQIEDSELNEKETRLRHQEEIDNLKLEHQ